MRIKTLLGLCLALAPTCAGAKELTFAGIELGETGCAEAAELLSEGRAIVDEGTSAITRGRLFELRAGAMGIGFIKGGYVVCGEGDGPVAAVELTIDKDQAGVVADLLTKDHREVNRNLPRLGTGWAEYVSESGQTDATIGYVHLSFEATVQMMTQEFRALMAGRAAEKEQERRRALDNAF